MNLIRSVKNKIQLSKVEDLIGFIKQCINPAASHLAGRRKLLEVVHNGMSLEEGGWNKEVINKRKREDCSKWGNHLLGGRTGDLLKWITSLPFRGWWAHVTVYLIGADQKIPNCPMKSAFLEDVGTAIRLDIKSWFGNLVYVVPFWVCGILFKGRLILNQVMWLWVTLQRPPKVFWIETRWWPWILPSEVPQWAAQGSGFY